MNSSTIDANTVQITTRCHGKCSQWSLHNKTLHNNIFKTTLQFCVELDKYVNLLNSVVQLHIHYVRYASLKVNCLSTRVKTIYLVPIIIREYHT